MVLKYPTTSKTLLEKLASGDEIFWDEFFNRYAPVVKSIAQYKGLKKNDAEDICQQVMLQFFQQSKTFKFDPDIAKFRTYFGRIVQSKILDFYRTKRVFSSEDELAALTVDPEIDSIFMDEWRRAVLKEAEQELKKRVSPGTFQAYELYAVQNRPVEKVAAYLECTENQVYQAKKRCFRLMREILLKMNEADPALQLELSNYDL